VQQQPPVITYLHSKQHCSQKRTWPTSCVCRRTVSAT